MADDPTQPPRDHRGKGTTQIELERVRAEKEIELARLRANEHTSAGEALRELRPIVLGVAALAVLGLAVYLGRELHLFGVGSTGGDSPPAVTPQRPDDDAPSETTQS